jgi:S-adenosylmethionine/arginine decarboxylase-like enzyme
VFVPNHLHLLVKGYIKTPPKTDKVLNIWFTQLVNNVGMKVVAGPTSVYVDEPGNEGITGTVTLATSHASIHVWDAEKPAMFQFDLYSCSDYTPQQVLKHIDEWFGLESATWQFIDRNTDEFIVIDSGKYKKRGWGKIRRFLGKIFDSSVTSQKDDETYK